MQENNYKKRFSINAISSVLLQIVVAVIGIIIPRMMIIQYGSETNGIIMSITQLLSYISLLEGGIGGVIRAALYKPLAEKNSRKLSETINASNKFFKRLGEIFLLYLIIIACIYPFVIEQEIYSKQYISLLIIILGAETLMQYFFGISYQMLLYSSQRIYIINLLQTTTLIANAIITYIFINMEMPIHIVKIVSMSIFILRPIVINIYARKQYKIDKTVGFSSGTLKNKWDGLGQHIAFFVHTNTDMVVLSLFSSLKEVSVYHIYCAVITAIKKVVTLLTSSVNALFGTLYAEEKKDELEDYFGQYESFIFILSTIVFSVTLVMILPFVSIYTRGISDAMYIRPVFGVLIVFAEYMYIIRDPYTSVALSAGFYKETRKGGMVEAAVNIIISLMLVGKYGVAGVAIGTLVAMSLRTCEFVRFVNRRIFNRNCISFVKKIVISLSVILINFIFCKRCILIHFAFENYGDWLLCSVIVGIATLAVVAVVNWMFDKRGLCSAAKLISKNK